MVEPKFKDMEMPEAPMPEGEEEEMELEFDEEEMPEEGGDLKGFSDDELVTELEARGFMVESEEGEEEPAEEEMAEEEMPEEEEEIV